MKDIYHRPPTSTELEEPARLAHLSPVWMTSLLYEVVLTRSACTRVCTCT